MQVVSYPEAEVPRELRLQQVRLQEQAWPSGHTAGAAPWHDPALQPVSVLLVDDRRVLAALDILSKDIVHRGRSYAASGLSAVVTDQERRGKGYDGKLVKTAREMIAASGCDLGIFTCDRDLQAFYERAGWQYLPGTVLVGGTPQEPFPSDQFDKVTMGLFVSPRARAHAEEFIGSRVGLYPGNLDKLW